MADGIGSNYKQFAYSIEQESSRILDEGYFHFTPFNIYLFNTDSGAKKTLYESSIQIFDCNDPETVYISDYE